MPGPELLFALRGVRKDYPALRPLRVDRLELREAETTALVGLDRGAAEVLVNLITGATLPDAGDVELFGVPTRTIADSDAWFRVLDRVGIFSERVVLLEELTVEQNLAIPITLEVEPVTPEVRARLDRLAAEVGLAPGTMHQPLAAADRVTRARVRLAKALALDPLVLLAEHPTAALESGDALHFAVRLSDIAAHRRLAMLIVTADAEFGAAACRQLLRFEPGTGTLAAHSGWRGWLTRRHR
jgi:predicted ABC-type transport system involved in lysophospholipase L1 biosynthesis ATPase subunit